MVTQSGQNAQADGDFMCDRCTAQVHIPAGRAVPKCPNCGNVTFSEVNVVNAESQGDSEPLAAT